MGKIDAGSAATRPQAAPRALPGGGRKTGGEAKWGEQTCRESEAFLRDKEYAAVRLPRLRRGRRWLRSGCRADLCSSEMKGAEPVSSVGVCFLRSALLLL